MNTEGSGELAHGYIVPGAHAMLPAVYAFLKQKGISIERNPDMYVREYKQFTVDDARELRDRAQTRAVGRSGRVFIVATPTMTVEAQNALLKTLEEPPAGATFFFIVPSPQVLLSTLRSRTEALNLSRSEIESSIDIQEFLSLAPEKRLDMLKPLYLHDEDDERDVRGAVAFLQELERVLASQISRAGVQTALEAVYRARKYLGDKGSLVKSLLEQVALLTPRM